MKIANSRYEMSDKLELLVVGAGPHSLSLISRILEEEPDDLLEEVPSNKAVYRIGASGLVKTKFPNAFPRSLHACTKTMKTNASLRVCNKKRESKIRKKMAKIRIIDGSGGWINQWERQFKALGITYLRSHIYAHPDPIDYEMMKVYKELRELKLPKHSLESKENNMESKENNMGSPNPYLGLNIPKLKDYEGPFQLPSICLFQEFCHNLVSRYHLTDAVMPGKVTKIKMDNETKIFKVFTEDNKEFQAKRVVLAIGPLASKPRIPEWAQGIDEEAPSQRLLHSSEVMKSNRLLPENIRGANILLVGGGITAGHLALRYADQGASSVTIVARRKINVRQYDLELKWMSNRRSYQMETFWNENFNERGQIVRKSKNGGSITPQVFQRMCESKKIIIHEEVQVEYAYWDKTSHSWEVGFENGTVDTTFYSHIILACGTVMDVNHHPLLSQLQSQWPIELVNGLPVLEENLQWRKDVPIHVLGAWAALHLGPGAVNLMGGRSGAARVARCIKEENSLSHIS